MRLNNIRPLGLWYGLFVVFSVVSWDAKAAAMDEIAGAFSTHWRVTEFNGVLSKWNKRELEDGVKLTKAGAKVQIIINIYTGAIKKGFTAGLNRDLIPRLVSREGDQPCYPIFRIINNFDKIPNKSMGMTSLGINIQELMTFISWLKIYAKPNLSDSPRFRCKVENNFDPRAIGEDTKAINEYFRALFTGVDSSLIKDDGWDGDY